MLMFGCTLAYLTMLYTDYAKAAHFGAVAVFLAWMELTLLTGRQTSEPMMNVYLLKLEIISGRCHNIILPGTWLIKDDGDVTWHPVIIFISRPNISWKS